ncbi:MAG: DNA primase [Parvularculaceae bacterium]
MRFSPDFLAELKSRLRASEVIGRKVQLKKQGREFAGLSPFTSEKTPSFFVNDDKAFYHCFSSGKHGDVITFLQETEGLSFVEAVKRLADEAGMELPRETEPPERAGARKTMLEAMAAASTFYQAELSRVRGREALDYLRARAVDDPLIEEFGLGFAPAGRTALKDHLLNKGFAPDTLIEAGLVIKPEEGRETYDRFRNRVMFPISDAAGRIVAFGGRALDPNARAKYLNSPETPLFHKGALLYNFGPARRAMHDRRDADGRGLLVCEGYMDVIGLARAGFRHAVAPLGTALTERQIELLWTAGPEPVLCFDGDAAGRRAAHRSIDRALPLLKPGRSLNFAFLPEGQDPDDLSRSGGAEAVRKFVSGAEPMIDALWAREYDAEPLDTPERKAGLKARLAAATAQIADPDIRALYVAEFEARFRDRVAAPRRRTDSLGRLPGPRARAGEFRHRAWGPPQRPTEALKRLRKSATSETARRWRLEGLLTLTILNHPALLDEIGEGFGDAPFADGQLDGLRGRILERWARGGDLDGPALRSHLSSLGYAETLARLDADPRLRLEIFARPETALETAKAGWMHAFSRFLQETVFDAELREAAGEAARDLTPEAIERLRAIALQARGPRADMDEALN